MSISRELGLMPPTEGELIDGGLASISRRLPPGWSLANTLTKSREAGVDATSVLRSPAGEGVPVDANGEHVTMCARFPVVGVSVGEEAFPMIGACLRVSFLRMESPP